MRHAHDAGFYFVSRRWRAGTLTNALEMLQTTRLPDLVILLNVRSLGTAVKECIDVSIPTIGIVDSDCDPGDVTYPIPCSDDGGRHKTIRRYPLIYSLSSLTMAMAIYLCSDAPFELILKSISHTIKHSKIE